MGHEIHKQCVVVIALFICTFFTFSVAAQSNVGEVHIYVFSEMGLPLQGVETEVGGEVYTSDESGLIEFIHPPGTHAFVLRYEGRQVAKVSMPVRQAQATEAIVTVSKQQPSGEVAVESAEEIKAGEDRKQIDETKPTGVLTGSISHIETGDPVANATVIFRGVDFETTTNSEGIFTAEVPEGTYAISVIHPDFSTQTKNDIEIITNQSTEIAMELTPSSIELEAVPVFATTNVLVQGGIANLIQETRNSGQVLNLIGHEQISRMGDSDAAAALRRVTGLTVVGGRFVYVRGMGERYSSSYLNDALLPSPEIDKRVVPLDLFPTSVIESMAIQKTYSPDMLGDFGGGAVRLRTMGIPEDRYKRRLRATLKTSVAYDMGATFTEQLLEDPGRLDWLGIDDGSRKMPESIEEAEKIVQEIPNILEGYTLEELANMGEALPNTWAPSKQTVPLDISVGGSIRDKIELSDVSSFSFSASLLYKNGYDSFGKNERSYGIGANDTLTQRTDYHSSNNQHNIDIGGLLDIGVKVSDSINFEATTLLTRITESETNRYTGYFSDNSVDIEVTVQSWVEEMLFNQKVGGEITLGFLTRPTIKWQYTFSMADRYQPDTRTTTYETEPGEDNYHLTSRAEGAVREYTNVTDYIHDGLLQVTIPVFLFSETSADFLDIGGQFLHRSRATDSRSFRFDYDESRLDPALLYETDPEELFVPEHIEPDISSFRLQETTLATDNYTARQILAAGFVTWDVLLFGNLRFNGGVRYEFSDQIVNTYDLFTGYEAPTAGLVTHDILPSLSFTLPLGSKMQLRLGGSRTINRPDFRELSDAPRDKIIGTGQLVGNPDLQKAEIYNVDARWEAYLAEEENLSVGGFYKYFHNAIEAKRVASAQNIETYTNVPIAHNLGAELEWQLTLRYLSDLLRSMIMNTHFSSLKAERGWRRFLGGVSGVLRDVRTTGNVSFIFSRVDYGSSDVGVNTEAQRPLQGQSPFVVNVSLGYKNSVSWSQHVELKTSIFLNYNVFGRRISNIGTEGLPDYYEEPFHQLDVVAKQQITEYVSISFKAQNLLDLPARETVGEQVVQEYRKGRSFSLGVALDF